MDVVLESFKRLAEKLDEMTPEQYDELYQKMCKDLYIEPEVTIPEDIFTQLEALKIQHRYCVDGWYSCPKHPDGCLNDEEGTKCNCGADKHNARVDSLIAQLRRFQ